MSKKLFYNGIVYLGNREFGYGFEIEKNRFKKIFKNKKEINFNDYKFKTNLENKLVLPSLIDSHCHLLLQARRSGNVDLTKVSDFDKVSELIKLAIESKYKNKKFICAENFESNKFDKCAFDRFKLDKISSKIPIFIFSKDLHSAFLNTKALMFLGIFEKNISSKYGQVIELDKFNLPTGILREKACQHIRDKIYDFYNINDDYKNLSALSNELIKYGISTVITCDIFEGKEKYLCDLYRKFSNKNKYGLDVFHQVVFYHKEKLKEFLDVNKDCKDIKIKDIKVFNDGTLSSKTAFLSKKYLNENSFGILNYTKNDLNDFINIANQFNVQLAIHSIGDKSSQKCIEVISDSDSSNFRRHKLIHFQLFDNSLIRKIKNHNILLSVQPSFLEDDLPIMDKCVDKAIADNSYCFNKCFNDKKNNISFSSDAPVISFNPWNNIYYALHGNVSNSTKSKKRSFNIYDAITCYTENGAYSIFEEKNIGKIECEYFANFIILNQNIFKICDYNNLRNTKVIFHYIKGKKIYNIDNLNISGNRKEDKNEKNR